MKRAPRTEDTRPRLSPLAVPQSHADTPLLPGESEAKSHAAVPARRGRLSHGQVGKVMNRQGDTARGDTIINHDAKQHPPTLTTD